MLQVGPQMTAKAVGWNRSSPIPTDPCYENYGSTAQSSYKLKNPIPADVGSSSSRSSRPASPKPRVKPEALAIARNNQGKELAYLFNPAMKIIPIGVRLNKKETIDHGKENYKKIKEIQRANKEKQLESSRQTPMKAVYKPDKFDHVQSKVAQQIKTPVAPRPATTDGTGRMRRSNSMGNLNITGKAVENRPKSIDQKSGGVAENGAFQKRRPASAREQRKSITTNNDEKAAKKNTRPSTASASNKRPKSHIQLNKEAVRNPRLKRSPSMSAIDDLKKKKEKELEERKRGSIPKYLRNRQMEWKKAEEERLANLPDPTIPEGHTLMAEEERKRTLDMLKSSHVEMMSELKAIPLSRDTMRIKQRKDELEKKLREVDSAIKIFSRPRVFIKNE